MKINRLNFVSVILLTAVVNVTAQNSVPRSLLPAVIVNEFIGEASGERAMNHIIEMGAYIHDRPASEYSDLLFESAYILSKLREYGLEGAEVKKYPGGTTWDGIRATLWEVSPGRSKIADYGELPAVLASGSTNADVIAELVWVGEGSQGDIDKADVAGKIVVTSGSISSVHSRAVAKGALGVVSFNSPRPEAVPLAIPISGLGGRGGGSSAKFGFFLPPREGMLLRDRLLSGEQIKVHAVVETQDLAYNLEVPTCIIKGTDPGAGEIIFSAHLFEGLVKMGANDNISGSASILEIARMISTMINEGRVERPKRTIRFIWVPEFSGTGPWVNENRELMKKTLCNINLDMVGLWLKGSNSFFSMHRTTYGNAHYINDVMENYFNFTGLGNRSGLAISPGREGYIRRIVAPTGTDDPFYFSIEDHYGASDHEVFNDWGVQVPGIMMITWPDLYYHTSQDIADKCDPTQLKRVCFIGAAAAYTIADAGDEMALKIAVEVGGNGAGRIGAQVTRAIDGIGEADAGNFESLYKLYRGYIEAAVINEKATAETTSELSGNKGSYNAGLSKLLGSINEIGKGALAEYDVFAEAKARSLGLKSITFKPTDLEVKAKTIVPRQTSLVTENGYRGYSQVISNINPVVSQKYPVATRGLDTQELGRLCNGKNSALDIKKLLDAQLKTGETSLQDVINYIYILSEAGLVVL